LSRLEADHLHPNLDWQDVRDLTQSALQNLGRTLAGHPVQVEVAPNLPPMKLDSALTEQILANLVSNAALHTPAGTPIEVYARVDSEHLILEVTDRGPGLGAEDLARLFDRFQRGADAAPGGTGIGL